MTVTHEEPRVAEAGPQPSKPKQSHKSPPKQEVPAQTSSDSAPEKPATKKPAPRRVAKGPAPEMTLADLCDHYIAHLESTKSGGTVLSYRMELDRAVSYFGADTPIGRLTHFDVARFNGSRVVMCKRDGKPKAAPSYLKTQRVLRLALVWAAEERKWLESAPIPPEVVAEAEAK